MVVKLLPPFYALWCAGPAQVELLKMSGDGKWFSNSTSSTESIRQFIAAAASAAHGYVGASSFSHHGAPPRIGIVVVNSKLVRGYRHQHRLVRGSDGLPGGGGGERPVAAGGTRLVARELKPQSYLRD